MSDHPSTILAASGKKLNRARYAIKWLKLQRIERDQGACHGVRGRSTTVLDLDDGSRTKKS